MGRSVGDVAGAHPSRRQRAELRPLPQLEALGAGIARAALPGVAPDGHLPRGRERIGVVGAAPQGLAVALPRGGHRPRGAEADLRLPAPELVEPVAKARPVEGKRHGAVDGLVGGVQVDAVPQPVPSKGIIMEPGGVPPRANESGVPASRVICRSGTRPFQVGLAFRSLQSSRPGRRVSAAPQGWTTLSSATNTTSPISKA